MDEHQPTAKWLNRTVVGAGITSFFADVGYEMATAVLSPFLILLTGPAAPAALGLIEGTADFASNLFKLATGWLGDRLGRRKPFVVFGYALTGCSNALWALAHGWQLIFIGKLLGWTGKGIRGPLRNAILADAVSSRDRGKAFGLHRAADTAGAVAGPLIGAGLVLALAPPVLATDDLPFRWTFALTLIPGIAATLAFAFLVREQLRSGVAPQSLTIAWSRMPTAFRRYLVGVGVFGLGDFSRTFLVFAVVQLFHEQGTPLMQMAAWGAVLYAWHNIWQALAAFPVGALSDRIGRRGLLVGSYVLGAGVAVALALTFHWHATSLPLFLVIFAVSGAYVAVEDALEGAMSADLVTDSAVRGTAFGILGAVNGAGDLFASVIVGVLWVEAGAAIAMLVAAGLMLLGALTLWLFR